MTPRLPLWGSLAMAVTVATLCMLGYWQVQRLAWKTSLIATLEAEYARDPLARPLDSATLSALSQQKQPLFYGSLHGQFMHEHEIRLGPRTHEGMPGYHLITPFRLGDEDTFILVNRGWVPLDPPDAAHSAAHVTLTGLARKPDAPNRFTPANDPANDTWYSIDPQALSIATGLSGLTSLVFYAETQNPPLTEAYPIMSASRILPRNNHKQYALFWFGMAGLFTLLYLFAIFKTPQNKQES